MQQKIIERAKTVVSDHTSSTGPGRVSWIIPPLLDSEKRYALSSACIFLSEADNL